MAAFLPALLTAAALWGLFRGVDLFDAMRAGASEGLRTCARMLPALAVLLPAVSMLRASGFLEALSGLCAPLFSLLGIPPETAALVFLRPFTGSGALAVGGDIIAQNGPDSYAGRCAAVMLGGTETTFYVVAVYFGAANIRKTRHAIPAALTADLVGFMTACAAVRLFFPP